MEVATIEFEPIVKQSGLEKAEQYAAIFAPFMITVKELGDKASTVNKTDPSALDAKLAREIRLAMVKNRTATGKQKDLSKSTLLAEGNLIQNLHNVVVNTSALVEADLDAIEKHAENKERERKAVLATERAAMFTEYSTDLTGYDLGAMADNVFNDLLESQKLLHEKRIADAARLEAERIAAEKAELERQAALKAENERLQKEADEKAAEETRLKKEKEDKAQGFIDRLLADGYECRALDYFGKDEFGVSKDQLLSLSESEFVNRLNEVNNIIAKQKEAAEKLEAERAEAARLAKIEQDKADALAKENAAKLAAIEAENKRVREKAAAELLAAKDAAAKAAKELQDKKDAEAKEAALKLAAEKKAAKAPVKEKLKVAVNGLALELPESEISADLLAKFNGFKTWALAQIEQL